MSVKLNYVIMSEIQFLFPVERLTVKSFTCDFRESSYIYMHIYIVPQGAVKESLSILSRTKRMLRDASG